MTLVLGVGFGHDASVTVLRDGEVVAHLLRERHSRVRHHLGIDRRTIEQALAEAGVTVGEIDAVAVTATQQMHALCDDASYFSIAERPMHDPSISPFTASDHLILGRKRYDDPAPEGALALLNEWARTRRMPMSLHNEWELYMIGTPLHGPSEWTQPYPLAETESRMRHFVTRTLGDDASPSALHYPITVTLDGRTIDGWFVNHHLAHAASAYAYTPTKEALIFSHDGGTGWDSGFVFLGVAGRIFPVGPHFLECGQFYDHAAAALGLGTLGGSGKLMGLASYGTGVLNDVLPAGTRADWDRWAESREAGSSARTYEMMFEALVAACRMKGYDVSAIGDAARVLEDAPREIAHSVQHLTEQTLVASILASAQALRESGLEKYTQQLCLTGGVALNCPANTRIWSTGAFDGIHIAPFCEDGGLTVGGAWFVHTHVLGKPAPRPAEPWTSGSAMIGPAAPVRLADLEERFGARIVASQPDDWTRDAAEAIARDEVIAIFEGMYESGPRALGHRSIVSNPAYAENWRRVNIIKGREEWRPFAPVVREEELAEWFEEGPAVSPFMLFTHTVRADKVALIPAVTHVDRTSRVQTVTASDDGFYRILTHLAAGGATPVIMNTSFNGPGEPIVQEPTDAVKMLVETGLDAVFIDGIKFVKAPRPTP